MNGDQKLALVYCIDEGSLLWYDSTLVDLFIFCAFCIIRCRIIFFLFNEKLFVLGNKIKNWGLII